MEIAFATRPYFGDPHCGDQCSYWRSDGKVTLCVVDGLGHGPSAEIAAKAAIAYVRNHVSEPLAEIFAPQTVALKPGYLVVMFTDGITERFDVSGYDGSVLSDMQQLADKIVEDWGRETDDNGVLVLRYESS